MALEGKLSDIDIGDLIQLNAQSGAQARLTVRHGDMESTLYFGDGGIVHARTDDLEGEEAVYEMLLWETGTFELEKDVSPPSVTISTPWSALVLEGMRRRDERQQRREQAEPKEQPTEASQEIAEKESIAMAETRKERLQGTLRKLVEGSSDIQGVAVISMDGLIISAALPPEMEQTRVGAVAAGILSLSGRSVDQLARGDLKRTMVQGSNGNIVLTQAGKNAAFVALTGDSVNLGLVFLEVMEGAQAVAEILG